MSEYETLKDQLAQQVVEAFAIDGEAPLYSVIHGRFVPYLKRACRGDGRARKWLLAMEWYRDSELIAESEGIKRKYNADTKSDAIYDYGQDIVESLVDGAYLVARYADQLGAPKPEFSGATLKLAFHQLRPTLSRQQGQATMRRKSADGRWVLVCHVFRDDVMPIPERQPQAPKLRRDVSTQN